MSRPENLAIGMDEYFKVFLDNSGILHEFLFEIAERNITWDSLKMLRDKYGWELVLQDGIAFIHNESRSNVNWHSYGEAWKIWHKALQEPFNTNAKFISMHGLMGFTHFREYDYKEVRLCDDCVRYMVKRDDGIITMFSENEFVSIFTTLTDSSFTPEKKKSSAKYMVSVVGGSAPVIVHDDYDIAVEEAERIAKQPKNLGKEVYVLKVKKVYRSEIVTSEATL